MTETRNAWMRMLLAGLFVVTAACNGDGDPNGDPNGDPAPRPSEVRRERQEPQLDGSLGGHCTAENADPQGTCDGDLVCLDIDDEESMCTRACTGDVECGVNGAAQNRCFPVTDTQGLCVPGCDPTADDPCRVNWTCVAFTDGPVCIPDCRIEGSDLCGTGETCDLANGICRTLGTQGHYGACGNGQSCNEDTVCIVGPSPQGVCLWHCTDLPEGCPTGSECAVELTNGERVCAQPCTPDAGGCPQGTECLDLGDGSTFCVP